MAPRPRGALPRLPHAAARRAAPRLRGPARLVRPCPAGRSSPRRASTRSRARGPSRTASRRCASGCAATAASSPGRRRPRCARCSRTCFDAARAAPPAPGPSTSCRCAPSSRRGRSSTRTRSSRRARARAARGARASGAARARARAAGAVALRGPSPTEEARGSRPCSPTRASWPQSVALAFDEPEARAGRGRPRTARGCRRSPPRSGTGSTASSFDSADGHHRDLLLALRGDVTDAAVEETMLWMIALGDRPGAAGRRAALRLRARATSACSRRPSSSGLSLWERVRAWAGRASRARRRTPEAWRSLFVRGLAAFFAAWRASDGRILPGQVVPDERGGAARGLPAPTCASSRSPAGGRTRGRARWSSRCGATSSSRRPGTTRRCAARLDPAWIYEAAVEGLGVDGARALPRRARWRTTGEPAGRRGRARARSARRSTREYHEPLALRGAVARYARVARANPKATPAARRQLAAQMLRLYGLERARRDRALPPLPPHLLRRRAAPPVDDALRPAAGAALRAAGRAGDAPRRAVGAAGGARVGRGPARLRRARLPATSESLQDAELRSAPGASAGVRALPRRRTARARRFAVREPTGPAEVGRLYRLLSESGLAAGRALAAPGAARRGGAGRGRDHLAHRRRRGSPTSRASWSRRRLRSQRLAGAAASRTSARASRAPATSPSTPTSARGRSRSRPGFRVDRRWGGLVRFLAPAPGGEAR